MNVKSKNLKVEPEFEDLFTFSSKKEKTEHRAQMISYRILSEIEKICEHRKIKMKELAAMVETSPSYITQLFRGNKQVNTAFMAKCEEAFDMNFEFSVRFVNDLHDHVNRNDLQLDLRNICARHPNATVYCAIKGGGKDITGQAIKDMLKEDAQNPIKQIV